MAEATTVYLKGSCITAVSSIRPARAAASVCNGGLQYGIGINGDATIARY